MGTRGFAIAVLAAAALAGAVAGPVAGVEAKKMPIKVGVGPDPNRPQADPESESGERPDPYVLFQLWNATPGRFYRIVVEDSPAASKAKIPCNPGLGTQWYQAFGPGEVAFPLEPVGSGTYMPFAGVQPCKGGYVMEVQERRTMGQSWKAVRSFAFKYPSFSFSYVPLARNGR